MLEKQLLPPWPEIFRRIGEPEPRRNRARCPIHRGDSLTSLSVNEERGLYHCFVCHAAGDKLGFVQRVQGTDFKGALAFFGVSTDGRPPKPDPAAIHERAALAAIREWCRCTGRRLRDEYYTRELVITRALFRVRRDPDDSWGWSWLAWAFTGQDRLEYLLDAIDLCRTDAERMAAWRTFHYVL
jgi:hypothetical protein